MFNVVVWGVGIGMQRDLDHQATMFGSLSNNVNNSQKGLNSSFLAAKTWRGTIFFIERWPSFQPEITPQHFTFCHNTSCFSKLSSVPWGLLFSRNISFWHKIGERAQSLRSSKARQGEVKSKMKKQKKHHLFITFVSGPPALSYL
jgi:hypothetical protein